LTKVVRRAARCVHATMLQEAEEDDTTLLEALLEPAASVASAASAVVGVGDMDEDLLSDAPATTAAVPAAAAAAAAVDDSAALTPPPLPARRPSTSAGSGNGNASGAWLGGLWSAATQQARVALSTVTSDKLMETVGAAKRMAQATAADLRTLTIQSVDRMIEVAVEGGSPQAAPTDNEPASAAADKVRMVLTSAQPLLLEAAIDACERLYGAHGFVLKGMPVAVAATAPLLVGFDAILLAAQVRYARPLPLIWCFPPLTVALPCPGAGGGRGRGTRGDGTGWLGGAGC
jgi:hypothetical protein